MSSISSRRSSLRLAAVAALALGGCATQQPLEDIPELTELDSVPFFPQTEFDCGPAALATVLGASGIAITPEALMPNVYTAGLEGSLQVEMLAAARREGRLPIPVDRTPEALFGLIEAGHPVLVMQNLRLRRAPLWHYAVVVGFERESNRVVLRSGEERRKRQRARRFLTSWALADNWGFVVARPGQIPATVEPEQYMRAVVQSERALGAEEIDTAYGAALARWPAEPIVLFLTAGHAYE
ncbi:MAG: PA2778 family cysteine peptidase, partial [Gammaproteobacteria bacterium]|nr:PA2778 family cysteine peptidase [Gammaproteobacteria bacterium]